MPRGPEGKIQDGAMEYARSKPGGFACKVESNYGGVPDTLLSFPASGPFMIEFKSPVGRASGRQKEVHAELRTAGVRVYLVRGSGSARKLIDDMADFGATNYPLAGEK